MSRHRRDLNGASHHRQILEHLFAYRPFDPTSRRFGTVRHSAAYVAAPVVFALFRLALGIFFVRLGERRLMNRITNAPPSTPIAAYLGNTVARSAGQSGE